MEKNCDIRKIINPYELVDIFYSFIIENNIYNKYQKKLRESKHVELGNVTYLINEVSKTKTANAYLKTPFYVLSFKDGEDFNYWIDNIMISWQSYISKYLDSCNCKIEKNVHKRTNITYADGSNDCKEQPNKKTNIQ